MHFDLQQGQTLGIVGKTGSGKTAILKLLLREFEGYKGHITYGDISIDDYTMLALREAIGYVPQDHFYFHQRFTKILPLQTRRQQKKRWSMQLP